MFKAIVDVQGMAAAFVTIKQSEAAVRDTLNVWGPLVIGGVYAGDNIANINNMCSSFEGVRRSRMIKVLKGFVPYEFDAEADAFTKKLDVKPRVAKIEAAFTAFIEGDDTLYGLINDQKRKEQEEKSPEEKRAAAQRAFQKAAVAATEQGVSIDVLLSILHLAAAEAVQELRLVA
jgi:hypothetical protein